MSTAIAALDLGTSRLRGAICHADGTAWRSLGEHPCHLQRARGELATCSFAAIWRGCEALLAAAGAWCREHAVEDLVVGCCGQVSSLLAWDAGHHRPLADEVPIWMDQRCHPSLARFAALHAAGDDRRLLGSRLPPGCNWLAVKLHHHLQDGAPPARTTRYLQLADGLHARLTGRCLSHPSSQVSLVDQRSGGYAEGMLAVIGIDAASLPELHESALTPVLPAWRERFGLPRCAVAPALQDTTAAMEACWAEPGDGILLASTSEVVGVVHGEPAPPPPERLCRARLGDGVIDYGSSSSGGASVQWLLETMLHRPTTDLPELEAEAAAVAPGCDGLLCLPYPDGERAPLWNDRLGACFLGMRRHHDHAHLLRALLEGVACARRQAVETLAGELPRRFIAGGGGTANALWNRIRASVLDRPLDLLSEGEPSLRGTLRHALRCAGLGEDGLRAQTRPVRIAPDPAWRAASAVLYERFLAAQGHVLAWQETRHAG